MENKKNSTVSEIPPLLIMIPPSCFGALSEIISLLPCVTFFQLIECSCLRNRRRIWRFFFPQKSVISTTPTKKEENILSPARVVDLEIPPPPLNWKRCYRNEAGAQA